MSETETASDWRVADDYRVTWPDPGEAPSVVLDAVSDLFYVADRRGQMRDWNDQFRDVLGYTDAEIADMNPQQFFAEDDREKLAGALDRVADGEEVTETVRLRTKSGDRHPFEFNSAPLTDEGGEVWGLVGIARDISERRERERELERYKQLVETVGDGAYVLGADRYMEWANDHLAEMLGYDREELVGMHISEITVPDSADRGAALRQQLLDGEIEVATIEGEMIRKDGSRVPSEGRFSLLDDSDGAVTIGLVRDITDRRERATLLEGIHEGARELMTAETKQDVAETAARVAYEYTDIETAGVRLLDGDELRLAAIEADEARFEDQPTYSVGEGLIGEVYADGEPVVYNHDLPEIDVTVEDSPVESGMLIPIEGHGLIGLASSRKGAFDEETQELTRLFAADVESALERADREERLREREQELQEYETLVETVSDGVYMSNEDYEFSMVNEAFVDMLKYDSREELLGKVVPEITVSEAEREKAVETRKQLLESDRQTVSVENEIQCGDGSTRQVETRFSLLPEDDGYRGTVGVVRDVSDRKDREALLKQLHEATRELQTAETKQDVAERVTDAAERLGFSTIGVRTLTENGELEVVAQSIDSSELVGTDFPTYEVGDGVVGEAYAGGELIVYDDLGAVDMGYDPSPVTSAMFVPVPGHGVLSIGSTEPGAFDETDRELARLLGADVASAFARADREEAVRAREERLERQQIFTNDLLDAIEDVFYIVNEDGDLLQWNRAFTEVTGYSDEELEGMQGRVLFPEHELGHALDTFFRTLEVGQTRIETEIEHRDGTCIPHEFDTSTLETPEGDTVVVGIARDISERKAREEALRARERELEEQQAYTNDLLDAIDDVFYILDEDGNLSRWNESLPAVTGYSHEEIDDMNALEFFEPKDRDTVAAAIAEGYETGDAKVEVEFATKDGALIPHEFVASALEDPDGNPVLTGIGRDVTERREQKDALREREQELQRQRDELETLNRINELIQGTIHSIASAATRDEIESTVCERLAESPFYEFAWTGGRTADDSLIVPHISAGDGDGYLDEIEIPGQASDVSTPGSRAIETGEVAVVDDIASDPQFEPWREQALERGFRSLADIPLKHGQTVHGVLGLYAGRPDGFSDREKRAFEVLGDMVGFAISAIQHRRLIEAETVLELEIELRGSETFFSELSRRMDCTCRLLGSVPSGDAMLHYVSVTGASAEAIEAYIEETSAARVDTSRIVRSTDEGCVVAVRVFDSTPELLQEAGARTVDITIGPESTRVVARAVRDIDIRMLLDAFYEVHGEPVLDAKREVERDHYTDEAFRADVADRLTERQDAALSAAYFGGYFDWPRDSTAEEVAESLDISSATLHQHLRHAQHKLLEIYFDDTAARTRSRK